MSPLHIETSEVTIQTPRMLLAQSIFSLYHLSLSETIEFCTPGHAAGRLLHPMTLTVPTLPATSHTATQAS